jgi:hypothetical protein
MKFNKFIANCEKNSEIRRYKKDGIERTFKKGLDIN